MTEPRKPDPPPEPVTFNDWPHWQENAKGCWELAISELRKKHEQSKSTKE